MMRSAQMLAAWLLEAPPVNNHNARTWPEFKDMSDDDWDSYFYSLPTIWLNVGAIPDNPSDFEGYAYYGVDKAKLFFIAPEDDLPSFRFSTGQEFYAFFRQQKEQEEKDNDMEVDVQNHVYTYQREPDAPKYPLEQKRGWAVFEYGNYLFIKMPTDANFLRREGIDMQHCLSVAHHDYCRRMQAGELDEYSMVDIRDGLPRVDIEVALKRGSYSHKAIERPTVTQIRGMRNEMPPKDEYLEPIMAFLQEYGKGWAISGHGVNNFDGKVDGDRVVRRWQQLQGERASDQRS